MCIIFITIFGNILFYSVGQADDSIPLHGYFHRIRRQGPIVQPDWIPGSEINLFEDFNVRVTDRKLEETEAIRDYIQETVDSDTYAVELDENDFEEGELQSDEEGRTVDLPEPKPVYEVKPNTPSPGPQYTPKSVPEEDRDADLPEPEPTFEVKPNTPLPGPQYTPKSVPEQHKNTPLPPPKTQPNPTNSSNRRRLFAWLSKRFNRP